MKRPTSFNLDVELYRRFKARCAGRGDKMRDVLELFMVKYLDEEVKG